MDTLHITLFGQVTVIHPNCTKPAKLSRSNQSLLAYLLLQPHLVPRDVLMDVFWMNYPPERARSSLTTAIWRLRQVLEPENIQAGTYLISKNSGEVGFNWDSNHWLDIESFEKNICPLLRKPLSALGHADIEQIEQMLPLYQGELLEGLYEDWALRERERFRLHYLNSLIRLMEFHANCHNFEQSIAFGHQILRCDPLREDVHRDLMRIYLASGQRTLAIRQYVQCRELLNQELSIPPLEETETLYQQILDLLPVGTPTGAQPPPQEIVQLVHELRIIKRSLDDNTKALARIAQVVNRFMGDTVSEYSGPQMC